MSNTTLLAAGVLLAAFTVFQTMPATAGSAPSTFNTYYERAPAPTLDDSAGYDQVLVYSPRRSSCNRAHKTVRDHGYEQIRTVKCKGRNYTFHARRDGQWWKVKVRARNGRIRRVYPM